MNGASESNQIYEYVPNPRALALSADGTRWEPVVDLSYFAARFADADYSLLAVFPADVTLTRLKVRREPNACSKFMVKYLNINF